MNEETTWLTERMDRDLTQSRSVSMAIDNMRTGLCVLACCVEPDQYARYKAEFNIWVQAHEEPSE